MAYSHTMKKVKALVVAINRPIVASNTDTWSVQVTWMSKAFSFLNQHGELIEIKARKQKREIFTSYRPELHSWIDVSVQPIEAPLKPNMQVSR